MKITVSLEHIQDGSRFCLNSCPVALALKSATGKTWQATHVELSLIDEENFYALKGSPTPAEVQAFMQDFDRNLPVAPFTFELEISK